MARTTIKRKSGSALPISRKGSLSPSPTPDDELHSSDGHFINDAPAAKRIKKQQRKSEPVQGKADEEYDMDVGRAESHTFLKLVEFESMKKRKASKANKGFMEGWEKGVAEGKDQLRDLLEEGHTASEKRDERFLETFKTAYGASRSHVYVQSNGALQDFAAHYERSQEMIGTAFVLVSKFEEVAQRIERIDTTALVENEWGDQDQAFAAILQEGKDIGVKRYRRMLNDGKEVVLEGEAKGTASMFFEERGEKGEVKAVWGKIVKRQEKAFRKLGKIVEVA